MPELNAVCRSIQQNISLESDIVSGENVADGVGSTSSLDVGNTTAKALKLRATYGFAADTTELSDHIGGGVVLSHAGGLHCTHCHQVTKKTLWRSLLL